MTKKNGKSAKINTRQRRLVKGLVEGKSASQAARDAGYAPVTARRSTQLVTQPVVQAALKDVLVRAGLTNEKLARRLNEGINAKETKFFSSDGRVTDQRTVIDLGMRHQYLSTVFKLRGDLVDRHEIKAEVDIAELLAASFEVNAKKES